MKKYLEFYHEYYGHSLPQPGLCNCFGNYPRGIMDDALRLFVPNTEEKVKLARDGYDLVFWASGLSRHDDEFNAAHEFTPLRQTIVLFMAAMEGEL